MAIKLKIGTRGSALALAQAREFCERLKAVHEDAVKPELVVITTTGDQIKDKSLTDIGGKGLFVKEIEEELLLGKIDVAVHSMKDVPTFLPEGLEISCLLPREDARDAFLSRKVAKLDDLAQGAVLGTSSPRRQAQLLARRPDLKIVLFRGNVDTRLKKLEAGEVDATLLAVAGLKRLGRENEIREILDTSTILPAAAQGAIGIQTRLEDKATQKLLTLLHCEATGFCVAAERGFLEIMDGSCKTPLAAHAVFDAHKSVLRLDGEAARPDGSDLRRVFVEEKIDTARAARELGRKLGRQLRATLPENFLTA